MAQKYRFQPIASHDDTANIASRTGQLVEVVARRVFGAKRYSVVRFADGYEDVAYDAELTENSC